MLKLNVNKQNPNIYKIINSCIISFTTGAHPHRWGNVTSVKSDSLMQKNGNFGRDVVINHINIIIGAPTPVLSRGYTAIFSFVIKL